MTFLNLASAKLGAQARQCSDDSFASMDRLLQDHAPVWKQDVYDDFGKWMDGWESKRRRSGGFDWCIIELAVPGTIDHFVVDTQYFTGNYPPGAQLWGATGDSQPAPDSPDWVPLSALLELQGDSQQQAPCLDTNGVYRWLKFDIYPDGGVARLRVMGRAVVEHAGDARIELSALIHGGRVTAYSDAHYGDVEAVLTAGRGQDMGDGWETKRRREPGNEWIILELGVPGRIDEFEIDTAHFKGNYPGAVSIQAANMPALGDAAIVTQAMFWDEILAPQPLSADHIHRFSLPTPTDRVTHIKVNSLPDGGMSRIRAFGRPDS